MTYFILLEHNDYSWKSNVEGEKGKGTHLSREKFSIV
jgi:hypothetical protein